MSWEDDDFEFKAPPGAHIPKPTDDVEEEDATLKEIINPTPAPGPAAPAEPETIKNKHILKAKKEELARKVEEEAVAARKKAATDTPLDDPAAEAARRRALQEKSDLDLAAEFFMPKAGPKVAVTAVEDIPGIVHSIGLSTTPSFEALARHVAVKVNESSGKTHTNAIIFYKEALRTACEIMTVDEIKDITLVLEMGLRRKMQEVKAKTAAKGGKKVASRAKVQIGRDDDDYGDYEGGGGADFADIGAGVAVPAPAAAAPAAAAYVPENVDGDFM